LTRVSYAVDADLAAELDADRASRGEHPALLYAFDGFVDAGLVAGLVVNDVVAHCGARRLVTFDADDLIHYRERRPPMVMTPGGWETGGQPDIGIDLVHDANSRPFLLCYGPEPDLHWEGFAQALSDIAQRFEVRQAVGMHGLPMAVPHTRPLPTTVPGVPSPLLHPTSAGPHGRVQVTGSAQALVEMRLIGVGLDAMTVAVHVPYYLSATPFPQAAVQMLRLVHDITGLRFDTGRLVEEAGRVTAEIAQQVGASAEFAELVGDLERRYDGVTGPAIRSREVPSGDELAAEVEAFLATRAAGEGPDLSA
jgi:hypothetical protein